MKCTPVKFEVDGKPVTAIVCGTRGSRPIRCQHEGCGKPGRKLCDWKVGEGKTCDMQLCDAHATQPARGKDLCPVHSRMWAERQGKLFK